MGILCRIKANYLQILFKIRQCSCRTLSFKKDWELTRKKDILPIFYMLKRHLDNFSLENSSTFGLISTDDGRKKSHLANKFI
jgi:hypothetical protein